MSSIYISQQNRGKTNWNRCKIVAVEVWREGKGGGGGAKARQRRSGVYEVIYQTCVFNIEPPPRLPTSTTPNPSLPSRFNFFGFVLLLITSIPCVCVHVRT